MKHFRLVLLSFMLVLLFSGCSWVSEVFIFNTTDHIVKVRIGFMSEGSAELKSSLAIFRIAKWETGNIELGDTLPCYSRNEAGDVQVVDLPAQGALRVGEFLNVDMQTIEGREKFLNGLRLLDVVVARDTLLHCEGKNCDDQLRGFSQARAGYVIE